MYPFLHIQNMVFFVQMLNGLTVVVEIIKVFSYPEMALTD